MKRVCEAAMLLIGTLGWWGFVYPDLCLTQDAYEQEYEEYEDYRDNERCEEYKGYGERQSEGGEVKEAFKIFSGNKADAEKKRYNKKEALQKENKGKTEETQGTIRIKSRLIEYVYQGR